MEIRFDPLTILALASIVFVHEAQIVLDCAYDEWQCGDQCIKEFEMCNETCPPWYMKCESNKGYRYVTS